MPDAPTRPTAAELDRQSSELQELIDQAKDLQRKINDHLKKVRHADRPPSRQIERRRRPR